MELDIKLLESMIKDDSITSRQSISEKYDLSDRIAGYYWFVIRNHNKIKGIPSHERRVLVIGDLHAPFIRAGYLQFCQDVYAKYDCTDVVFIGDIIDNHYSSYHETDPDGHSAGIELLKAKEEISNWYRAFPVAKVCIGNHDCYDDQTEILTKRGWIKGVDLNQDDIVGTMDMDGGFFEWQKPTSVVKYDYVGDMYSFQTPNNVDLVVTPNHRIIHTAAPTGSNGRKYTATTADKTRSFKRRGVAVSCVNNKPDYSGLSDLEIQLLGWIYSDGCISQGYSISQSKYVDKVRNILIGLGIEFKEKTRMRETTQIAGKTLHSVLPNTEFYFKYDKFSDIITERYVIPEVIYLLSKRQFDIFLDAYIDGDGARKYTENGQSKNGCAIDGKKEILDQIQWLCFMNNHSATLTQYRQDNWRLNVNLNKSNAGLIPRVHRSVVHYDGVVWCAHVQNTTLVVRRNGKPIVQGNSIPARKLMTAGLSSSWLKSISEVIETPNWEFAEEFIIDDVKYCHGTGRKARARAKDDLISVVQGHYHSESYIEFFVGQKYKIFAMQIGTGVDQKSYAMAYGKHFKKMHVDCGVVLEGGNLPILEFMKL